MTPVSPPSTKLIRIMLIDDQEMVRTALRMLIESHSGLKVVCETGNHGGAILCASREQPDIILLDLDLYSESGLELIADLKAASGGSRILALTGAHEQHLHNRAVMMGAVGLLLKDRAADTLIKAINKIYDGEAWLDHSTMALVLSELLHHKEEKKADPDAAKMARLTKREIEVIKLVAEGMHNQQIADNLRISESTVRHHLTSIFGKLDVSNRFELNLYAYRHGLASP